MLDYLSGHLYCLLPQTIESCFASAPVSDFTCSLFTTSLGYTEYKQWHCCTLTHNVILVRYHLNFSPSVIDCSAVFSLIICTRNNYIWVAWRYILFCFWGRFQILRSTCAFVQESRRLRRKLSIEIISRRHEWGLTPPKSFARLREWKHATFTPQQIISSWGIFNFRCIWLPLE